MSSDEPGDDQSGAPAPSQGDKAPSSDATRAPSSLVRPALLFYGGMLGVALTISLWTGDVILPYAGEPPGGGFRPHRDVAAGLIAGALVILLSHEFTRRTQTGAALADALAAVLGRMSTADCLVVAAASGIAEECFFRGVLQPNIGLVASALVFGVAHFVPRRDLAPWALLAVVAGLLLGALFEATGNLVAPVVAHATINGVNLSLLSRRPAAG
ncbi:MAG: lysostaphin resistance A-like protein [Myxococcota bacterium]